MRALVSEGWGSTGDRLESPDNIGDEEHTDDSAGGGGDGRDRDEEGEELNTEDDDDDADAVNKGVAGKMLGDMITFFLPLPTRTPFPFPFPCPCPCPFPRPSLFPFVFPTSLPFSRRPAAMPASFALASNADLAEDVRGKEEEWTEWTEWTEWGEERRSDKLVFMEVACTKLELLDGRKEGKKGEEEADSISEEGKEDGTCLRGDVEDALAVAVAAILVLTLIMRIGELPARTEGEHEVTAP